MQKQPSLAKGTFIYFISAFLFLGVKLFMQLNWFGFLGTHASLIVNAFVQIFLMLVLPAMLYMLLNKRNPRQMCADMQIRRISWRTVLAAFAAGIAMYMCVIIISSVAGGIWTAIGYRSPFAANSSATTGGIFWLFILPALTSAVLPGICEEFVNRGILQQSLNKVSPRYAIFFSALLFGLLHYNINQAVYAFFVGLVLGAITHFSKSIWPAIIMHFTNNFCSVFLDYAQQAGWSAAKFNSIINSIFAGSAPFVAVKFALFSFVSFMLLFYAVSWLYNTTAPNRMNARLKDVAQLYMGEGVRTGRGIKYEKNDVRTEKGTEGEVLVKMQEEVIKNVAEHYSQKNFLQKWVPSEPLKKAGRLEKIFLAAAIFMTASLTLFTFIWGLL